MSWLEETLYNDIRLKIKGEKVCTKKTAYQKLDFYQTPLFGKVLVLDGAIQTTEKDEFIYHEMLTHPPLFLHPKPKNILIIGGGDGGILREVLKHPVNKVTMVEIDQEVIKIAKEQLRSICKKSFEDKRVKLIIDDGAKFIKNTKEKYDVAIIDSPDPIGAAKVLFSYNFYNDIHNILTAQGIMIRQTGSTFLQAGELKENSKILKKIFNFIQPIFIAVPTYIGGFFSLTLCSKKINPQKINKTILKKKYKRLNLKTKYYNPEIHLASMAIPNYVKI